MADTREDLIFEIRTLENKMDGLCNPIKIKVTKRQLKELRERLKQTT